MKTYHPNLDGPAEPVGMAMGRGQNAASEVIKIRTMKPRFCQWMGPRFLSQKCTNKPKFQVQQDGHTCGWVCTKHSVDAAQLGWKIK